MIIAKPIRIIKTSTKSPVKIRAILIIAPKVREIKLEIRASNHLFISNPLPGCHLYLLQGANKVLRSRGREK